MLDLSLSFLASSPDAPVTQMRVRTDGICFQDADMKGEAWQPYQPSMLIAYKVATINWVGLWVSVQYRDALGNVSPVACDDISIEGMPPVPTQDP